MSTRLNASSPIRILIVEDHDLLRALFLQAFRDAYEVQTASSAEEGWDKYAAHKPDVVFLDIRLPDVPGHALAERIKADNPKAYIVMATAYDSPTERKAAENNHVDGYIVKPFDKNTIMDHIERYKASRSASCS